MYSFEDCFKNLEHIGDGSSRVVYALNENEVLKKAYTKGGIWQNKNELSLYKKYKDTDLPLCKINLDLSTSHHVIMERAEYVFDVDKKLHNNLNKIVSTYVDECSEKYNTKKKKTDYMNMLKDDKGIHPMTINFMEKIVTFRSDFISRILFDVCSINCGVVNDEVVIIDYGYPFIDEDKPQSFYGFLPEYRKYLDSDENLY